MQQGVDERGLAGVELPHHNDHEEQIAQVIGHLPQTPAGLLAFRQDARQSVPDVMQQVNLPLA